jgi:hypothetical protein
MNDSKKKKIIPEYHRIVSHVLTDAHNLPYFPLKSIEEARNYDDSFMIMEGDDGGQVYVVAPVKLIRCSKEGLESLLVVLDKRAWPDNDDNSRGIYYERRSVGEIIHGGMGGGIALNSIWVHD